MNEYYCVEKSDVSTVIDLNKIVASRVVRRLDKSLILPATENVSYEIAEEHQSEPIKDIRDVMRITEYLVDQKKYRDNMLFIMGINLGLRISDLLTFQFSHIINDDFTFKTKLPILEKKTKNTRKSRRNRYISINDAVVKAVTIYLQNTPGCKLSDYMFRSESNNGRNANEPMNRVSVHRIMNNIKKSLALDVEHFSSHTLRKTFAYFMMLKADNEPRKLLLLQKMFGHRSILDTLDYIGITGDEIEEAYMTFNLGLETAADVFDGHLIEAA